ncbi:MAG: 2-oxo acid dehydrogenase subunit E2 [Eubacterium sp.]|nr:2-oxo acid dehydrogenase subunit E2 [Eubacterium sp.]
MANAVIMPKAGITVESCIIGEWLKKPGDHVEVGDILFTYETDKANFECESTAAGELLECFYGAGDEVVCLSNVCAVGEHGEDVSALRPDGGAAEEPAPAQEPAASEKTDKAEAEPAESFPVAGKIGVSPRARGLAQRSGTDLSGVAGTGPKGRVIERDVRRVMANGPDFATEVEEYKAAPAAAVPAADDFVDVPFTGIRKTISRSMYQSIQSMAQLTHNFSFDATALKAYRTQLKACGGELAGITLGDMILFGVSRTLLSCPDLNALMQEENTIRRYAHVHLGVAVDTERGLMVPTIFNADTKSLLQISREVKELAAMCRSGSISPDLLRGGTFTVSNLGAYGVESFTPVINPPQTGLLGVCTITERPRTAADGSMELYPAMALSLTYDHRAVDGAPASRYMQELCKKLENFTALLAE